MQEINGRIYKMSWIQPRTFVCGAGAGGRFIGDLQLEYIDGRNWRLIKDFVYITDAGIRIVIPAGFVTDFASVPRIFWTILPPAGSYGPAAVLHDFLYRTHAATKDRADRYFFEAMTNLGVPTWKRYVMYNAVHYFGGPAYNKGGK